ncbi:bifunctional chorismate mutase/prephenate dehydratase [Helicovermis profundi]|uniref:Bifunctional chorismate mutase/prephenate dehydratase n=1 Tax=Helicovermis profundi TaxID=3065157 RepID=A0AAU9EU86_9FIRM|nr:prephenate dehydratase [Clostridia bacterium S502]
MKNDELNELRKHINSLDDELAVLLSKRLKIVVKIAKYKYENKLDVVNNSREEEIIERINLSLAKNDNNEFAREVELLMKYIMNQSKAKQSAYIQNLINFEYKREGDKKTTHGCLVDKSITVAFQGIKGSYSHEALDEVFGKNVKSQNYKSFRDVFVSVNTKKSSYGILPIENSSTGNINEVYDLLEEFPVNIVGEKIIRINHCIIGLSNSSIDNIEELYSHPQAFLQTSEYLNELLGVKKVPYFNTAISVKKVKDINDGKIAAIGSRKSARIYDLKILKKNINNAKNNYTKFIIISHNKLMANSIEGNGRKVSLLFTVDHKSGSLYKVLESFAINEFNLLKLESRPIVDKPWEYMFYVDIEGSLKDFKLKSTIDNIIPKCIDFRVLGEYNYDNNEKDL